MLCSGKLKANCKERMLYIRTGIWGTPDFFRCQRHIFWSGSSKVNKITSLISDFICSRWKFRCRTTRYIRGLLMFGLSRFRTMPYRYIARRLVESWSILRKFICSGSNAPILILSSFVQGLACPLNFRSTREVSHFASVYVRNRGYGNPPYSAWPNVRTNWMKSLRKLPHLSPITTRLVDKTRTRNWNSDLNAFFSPHSIAFQPRVYALGRRTSSQDIVLWLTAADWWFIIFNRWL